MPPKPASGGRGKTIGVLNEQTRLPNKTRLLARRQDWLGGSEVLGRGEHKNIAFGWVERLLLDQDSSEEALMPPLTANRRTL